MLSSILKSKKKNNLSKYSDILERVCLMFELVMLFLKHIFFMQFDTIVNLY